MSSEHQGFLCLCWRNCLMHPCNKLTLLSLRYCGNVQFGCFSCYCLSVSALKKHHLNLIHIGLSVYCSSHLNEVVEILNVGTLGA